MAHNSTRNTAIAVLAFALSAGIAPLTANAQSGSATASGAATMGHTITKKDKKYLVSDAQGAMYELALAKAGADKATDPKVRQYAQMLVDDHDRFNAALIQLGQEEGVTLPTTMTAKDQARLTRVTALSGAAFDKAFVKEAVRINKQDAKESEKESAQTEDTKITQFIQQFVDVDKKHLSGAEALMAAMK